MAAETDRMPSLPESVQFCIARWPAPAQARFAELRVIVHRVAQQAEIGTLTETLKWGQPSWRAARPRVGSTLRCDWRDTNPNRLSLYVHCQTKLVETMRSLYPKAFAYKGRRALHMPLDQPMPSEAVDHCALLTLAYHRLRA